MDTNNYQQLLKKRFGKPLRTGEYLGKTVPIVHECRRCGIDFRASPARVITGGMCLPCTRAADTNVGVTAGIQFLAKLAAKYDHIKCLEFGAVNRAAKFSCWCGHQWQATPRQILGAKNNPCPACASAVEEVQFDAAGRIRVLHRTGRVWIDVCGKLSTVRCWCGTRLKILTRLVTSPATECPTCLGLPADSPQIVYKFKGIEYISYHNDGTVLVPDVDYGWAEIKVKTRQIAKTVVPTLKVTFAGKYVTLPIGAHLWNVADVEAWQRQIDLTNVTVLSLDPGVTNCAWAALKSDRDGRVKLLGTGMIQNTVKEFTGDAVCESSSKFTREIQQLMEEFSVTHLIAERFMSRGMKGLTIELVNAMLGILINSWKGRLGTFKLITAAQWKNEWNRNSDLTAFYSMCACEVHQVDAIGIGLYGIDHWFNRKPFEHIRKLEKTLTKQIRLRNFG